MKKTVIHVSSQRRAPARFKHHNEWYYATGRCGSYDDGETIGMAFEYELGALTIWIADDFTRVLHEPERHVDGRRDKSVIRATIRTSSHGSTVAP